MDREAANWLAVIERENRTVPLFVRKSSNDIQLGKVANEHDFLSAFAFFLCVWCSFGPLQFPKAPSIHIHLRLRSRLVFNDNSKWSESKCERMLFLLHIGLIISISMLHNVHHFNYCSPYFCCVAKWHKKICDVAPFQFLTLSFFSCSLCFAVVSFPLLCIHFPGFFFTSLGRPELMREKNPSLRIKQNQYSIDTCKMVPLLGVILTTVLIKSATPNASPDPMHTLLCIGNEHERATVWFLVPSIQTIIDTLTAYWNLA